MHPLSPKRKNEGIGVPENFQLKSPAGWMSDLVSGLQNRIERFDSATGLQAARKWAAYFLWTN